MIREVFEAKGVQIYKKLLRVLGDYSRKAPATGVDKLFDTVVDLGKKILPKNKTALTILDCVLSNPVPVAVQRLLNMRFSDLPKTENRPIYKKGNRYLVAWWSVDGQISDKVQSLIDFKGTGKTGRWTDLEGDDVTLIDLSKKEKK